MVDDDPHGMLAIGLAALRRAVDLEGACVIRSDKGQPALLHETGFGGSAILPTAWSMLLRDRIKACHATAPDGRPVMVRPFSLPPERPAGLAMWRAPGKRGWQDSDHILAAATAGLVHTMLEHGPAEAGLDRLTGLPNRVYFLDEVDRHIDRLDLDRVVGTMLFIDLDDFRRLNVTHGRQTGDRTLIRVATMLRAMARPSDVVGRVGGDEFAVWCDGMDHMTAAERSETLGLRRVRSGDVDEPGGEGRQSLSIGIASRQTGSFEDARTLLRRAHMAAYEVKADGGAGWRVSPAQPPIS